MNLSSKQRAFFLLAISQRGKAAVALFSFLPASEAQSYASLFEELKTHNDHAVRQVAHSELARLAGTRQRSFLADVHVDWLAEALGTESPALIATVLRCLPVQQSHEILDRLGALTVGSLPSLSDTFGVPQGLIDHIRNHFESQFVLPRTCTAGQALEFEHLCVMPARLIEKVFLHIGYQEISLALTSLPQKACDQVLDRLAPDDRRAVSAAMGQQKTISLPRIKLAQDHLIEVKPPAGAPQLFVTTLGFLLYAKAVLPKDLTDVSVTKKKMPKALAVFLQDTIDHVLSDNTEASAIAFREDVLKAMKTAISKG